MAYASYSDYYKRLGDRSAIEKNEFGDYFKALFGSGASANDMVLDFLKAVSSSSQGTTQGANALAFLEALQNQQYETGERLASQQWQEYYYNKYSSPSAMVEQYKDAGLNPALMYGSAGASTGDVASSSPANGAVATPEVVSPFNQLDVIKTMMSSFSSIVSDAYNVQNVIHQGQVNKWYDKQVQSDLELKQSQTLNNYADTNLKVEQTETEGVRRTLYKAETEVAKHQVNLIDSQVNKVLSDIDVNDATIQSLMKDCQLKDEQIRNARKEWEKLDDDHRRFLVEQSYGFLLSENQAVLQSVASLNDSSRDLNVQSKEIEDWKHSFEETTGVPFGSDLGQVLSTCAMAEILGTENLGLSDYGQDWKKLAKRTDKYSRRRNYDPKGTAAVAGSFMVAGRAISLLGGKGSKAVSSGSWLDPNFYD